MMVAFENRSSFATDKKRRLKAVETAAFMMQEFQTKVKVKFKMKIIFLFRHVFFLHFISLDF